MTAVPVVLAAQIPECIQILQPEAMPEGMVRPTRELQELASSPGLPDYNCNGWNEKQLGAFEKLLESLGELAAGVLDDQENFLNQGYMVCLPDNNNPNGPILIRCFQKLLNLNVGPILRTIPIRRPALVSPTAELTIRRSLAWSRFDVLGHTVDRLVKLNGCYSPPKIGGLARWLKASHFVELEMRGIFDLIVRFLPKNDGVEEVQNADDNVESLSEEAFEKLFIAQLDNKIQSVQYRLNQIHSIVGETISSILDQCPNQSICAEKLFEVGFGPGKLPKSYDTLKEQLGREAELSPRIYRLFIVGMTFGKYLECEALRLNLVIAQMTLERRLNIPPSFSTSAPDVARVQGLVSGQSLKSARH